MTPTVPNLDPLNTEAVRLAVRTGLQRELDAANGRMRTNYEAQLVGWKGEAEKAAGQRKPLPIKPPAPAKLVLSPDDGTWNFVVLEGSAIAFTDVEVAMPYEDGFFPPQEFMGQDRYTGDLIYNAKPGCQYANGARYSDARGSFVKVRTPFNANGGGHWLKVG